MKKSLFKVLCMVLIIALLAPNAFAATPAPEAPLADAATVERVKQEIANGEITDMEDLFWVAYQHLGADLKEEGMTAYINEDGTLGVTQIIENDNGGASVYSLSGGAEEKTIALTAFAILDNEANLLTDYEYYYNHWELYDSNNLDTVYATHIMYVNVRKEVFYDLKVQLNYMVTNLSHSTPTYLTSKLVQSYQGRGDANTITDNASRTLNNPGSSVYTFTPNSRTWFDPTSGSEGGGLYTYSEVVIANTGNSFVIGRTLLFDDNYIDYDNIFPD